MVGGHEDHVLAAHHLGRVLLGVGTEVVAFDFLGVLLAAAQEACPVERFANLLGFLKTRNRQDTAGVVLQDRQ